MRHSPSALVVFLLAVAIVIGLHGVFLLGQAAIDSLNWRRTNVGWEHANSLPIPSDSRVENQIAFQLPSLKNPRGTLYQIHLLILPLAITGFLACFGSWLLLRWPTNHPLKN